MPTGTNTRYMGHGRENWLYTIDLLTNDKNISVVLSILIIIIRDHNYITGLWVKIFGNLEFLFKNWNWCLDFKNFANCFNFKKFV